MIDQLSKNIEQEIAIVREIADYSSKLGGGNRDDDRLLQSTIESLATTLKIINNATPELLNQIIPSVAFAQKKQPQLSKAAKIERVTRVRGGDFLDVAIPSSVKKRFMKELELQEQQFKRLRKKKSFVVEEELYQASRGYLKLANKFFLSGSISAVRSGKYSRLGKVLRQANINMLIQSYIAFIYFTVFLTLFLSLIATIFLLFIDINLTAPYIQVYGGSYLSRLGVIFWIPIVFPALCFLALYAYPYAEKQSVARGIQQELPFAVIHMNAISGSGIEPSEIFKIIGLTKDYPHLRKEIRKVLNQIHLYGYDLVTSLERAAAICANARLAELFSGLGTTIHSGGSFPEFFEKRSETLLTEYRIEKEKYSKIAETFMDIYISVVIAAPMILLLFLIILYLGSFQIGLSTTQFSFLIIIITAVINIFFLIFIHLRQPSY